MLQVPKLTIRQREALALIAGHPEAVVFDTVQELESCGLLGGAGSQLEITELGKLALAKAFGDPPWARQAAMPDAGHAPGGSAFASPFRH